MKSLRKWLALLVGKTLILFSRLLGNQGSNFPGRLALRIYPGLLHDLAARVEGQVILVTGTNGKTTTANMIAAILRENGSTFVHNRAGANMLTGITTAFIECTNLRGNRVFDYALLETDEANVPLVFKHSRPGLVLVTNFFRDQLDRYGELDYTVRTIRAAVQGSGATLLLNGDDPVMTHFLDLEKVNIKYYGFAPSAYDSRESLESREGRYCIRCGQELRYDNYHYAQLGQFRCPGCGNRNPTLDFTARDLQLNEGIGFRVNDLIILSPYRGFYNAYNALAAVSVGLALGVDKKSIRRALKAFKPQAGRMETFQLGNKRATLILVKNPTGLNQALLTLSQDPAGKDLFLALNDNVADGRDISWIWDADLELIAGEAKEQIGKIVCSGLRSGDMAVRCKYAGFSPDHLILEADLKKGIVETLQGENEVVYLLSTYTALFQCRKILEQMEKSQPAVPERRVRARA